MLTNMLISDGYAKWIIKGRKCYMSKLRNAHGFRFAARRNPTATQALDYGHRLADRYNRICKDVHITE